MSILWYIGETRSDNQSILDDMCANYALRKFKTPESLISLFSVIDSAEFDHPFAMVADFTIPLQSKKNLESFSQKNFECSQLVYLHQAPAYTSFTAEEQENFNILRLPINDKQVSLSINDFLADLLRIHVNKRSIASPKICYKDITLDYSQQEYRIDAYNEVEKLSLKEAKLLHFFMINPKNVSLERTS